MRGERQRGAAHGNPYLEILRAPGAMAFSAAGVLARTPMAMFGLGTVLLIASVTGRYGVAGTVAAAGSVGYAACAPQAAKLADRFGQRRVLRPLALIFALSTIIFIGCAELRTPLWALLLSGAVAGASMPSLGSMVRARWSALLGDSPRLHTAFALESVNDEVIFVLGPVIVTILATEVYPASGVAAAMLLCVTGTLLLAAQRGTEPAPRNRPRPTAEPLPVMAPAPVTDAVAGAGPGRFRPPAAGLTGLLYGSRSWRTPVERRFMITLCCAVAGISTFWAQPGLLSLSAVIFLSGLAISPTFIAGYSLVERQAPVRRRTEGMAWLSSSISVGVAVGSAIAGHIIDAAGARWGYAFAAASGLAAVVTCLLGVSRLRLARPADVPT